ncbi:uncharacterized protein LOC133289168 [Gastrolobium bilobum]|uniref:uncharacterized protein LOC133289168 n=1 Tax=Gastrolobium bilobum TaxID=150636 RepID=UPI002AAF57D6|nr:uncharacterized protein LOC133289168 [Gastrolobium bilobum]
MNLPKTYWGEAVVSAAYLINRTPSSALHFKTPQQTLESYFSIPHISNLEPRVFGCTVYVHIPKVLRKKLDPCAKKCVFVGYSNVQKGYRCYDPVLHKMHVSMDVSFQELEPYYSGGDSVNSSQGEIPTTEEEIITLQHTPGPDVTFPTNDFATRLTPITEASSLDVPESIPEVNTNPTPMSSNGPSITSIDGLILPVRVSQRPNKGVPKQLYESDPNSKDALDDPNRKEAMNVEMKALQKNSTYKARLVAKGYTQKYGVDYQDTFAPVAKLNTIRILISIAANRDWPLKQCDDLFEMELLERHLANEFEIKDLGSLKYQRLVGRLIYLSHTRSDIAYAVSVVSRFMHNPSEDHMAAVYRILRYLKGCPGKGMLYSKNNSPEIKGYTDSDWAGDKTTRQSTSGYFTFVEDNLVTWKSKKQKVVARSSAEAEFRGMAHGVCELLWIKSILQDLGICYNQPMELHCDSKTAIEIVHNPVQHDSTKHVEVDRHFIKEKLDQKIIQFPYIKSEDQLADILTKAVSGKVFEEAINKLGMIDIYAPT